MMKLKDKLPLDDVASVLAGEAGQVWDALPSFPGYNRRRWRDEARAEVRRADPEARIECLPNSWDGKDGVCFIRKPATP